MRRIVSVWLPHLPIERLKRIDPGAIPEARPLALVAADNRGERISAVNARARGDGIRPGMALADARAMLPALLTRPAEPQRDAVLLARLARWAGRYGPARNCEGCDGLWIDITGVAHLFGSASDTVAAEHALAADLADRLAAAGLTAHIGLADTSGAAHALARSCGKRIVVAAPGETRGALVDVPVEALRLTPAAVQLLRRLGLGRIGDLYSLPRAALARRFRDKAMAAGVLTRLDQALGLLAEPRRPLGEPPVLTVRRPFAEPLIVANAIEAEVLRLAADLAGSLAVAGLGARQITLSLYRTDTSIATIGAGTSRPCRDPRHLYDLLTVKLATIDAGFGIDALVLDATAVEPLQAAQTALGSAPAKSGAGPAILIDRLANQLGAMRVLRLAMRDSHVPEQAAAAVPALLAEAGCTSLQQGTMPMPGARPPFLLARPEPIDVLAEVPEGAPQHFTWRRRRRRIVKAEGPERIAPQWWRALGAGGVPTLARRVRDYYRLEDQAGGRYWVFRAGLYDAIDTETDADQRPAWYLHGVFP